MLHALGATTKRSEGYQITTTGLLVFCKAAALRRLSPAHRVDYIRVQGKEWVADTEHRFESLDMRGPMIALVSRVMSTILDDLPKTFRVDDSGMRVDRPIIPVRVIREAVVNAVMHRNYQTAQPAQILRYSNRLEIRNPGYSLKSQERFSEPGSALRNPHIGASKSLRRLREQEILEDRGGGSRTYYVAGSVMKAARHSDDVSMDASIITNDPRRRLLSLSELPPHLRLRLERFRKRILPEDMRAFIVELCRWRPMSAEEVSSVLGKTSNYVSSRYLYPMVREGLLDHLFPAMVKHPGQKYIVNERSDRSGGRGDSGGAQ